MSAQFVIDASLALAWCFEDEGNAHALEILEYLGEAEAIVTAPWLLEVGNALRQAAVKCSVAVFPHDILPS
jgi:predicted nucleic acid-binding protein